MIRARNPRFTQEAIKANRAVVDLLEAIAAQHEATPAQIALAWLLRTNVLLKGLTLDGTGIGDGGATSLGKALEVNSALVQLDLESNEIGDGGVVVVEARSVTAVDELEHAERRAVDRADAVAHLDDARGAGRRAHDAPPLAEPRPLG